MQGVLRMIQSDAVKEIMRKHKALYGNDYLPEGLNKETLDFGVDNGFPAHEVVLRHLLKGQ